MQPPSEQSSPTRSLPRHAGVRRPVAPNKQISSRQQCEGFILRSFHASLVVHLVDADVLAKVLAHMHTRDGCMQSTNSHIHDGLFSRMVQIRPDVMTGQCHKSPQKPQGTISHIFQYKNGQEFCLCARKRANCFLAMMTRIILTLTLPLAE